MAGLECDNMIRRELFENLFDQGLFYGSVVHAAAKVKSHRFIVLSCSDNRLEHHGGHAVAISNLNIFVWFFPQSSGHFKEQ